MAADFERFGLWRFRRMTGGLELLGAAGLAAGYLLPIATVVSAAGLTLLMILGVPTRVRVGDSVPQTLPAAFLGAVNGYVLVYGLGLLGR